MSEKTGTRLRCPSDLRRYIAKILCRMEKLPDKEIQEKAGQISKTWRYMAKSMGERDSRREDQEARKGDLCHQNWTASACR